MLVTSWSKVIFSLIVTTKSLADGTENQLIDKMVFTQHVFFFSPYRGSNIIENMVTMMEKHANHLEQLVEERTRQLNEEKEKTEKILYRLLPP